MYRVIWVTQIAMLLKQSYSKMLLKQLNITSWSFMFPLSKTLVISLIKRVNL